VDLVPASGGQAPRFGGNSVWVHARIRHAMRAFYESDDMPGFLDSAAREFIGEGRDNFRRFGLDRERFVASGSDTLVFLWTGDHAASTLALELVRRGVRTHGDGVCLTLENIAPNQARDLLRDIHDSGLADPLALAALVPNLETEKHDALLTHALLLRQYAARFLDTEAARTVVAGLID
jgi:ATP-dependent Lhr-like helicase